MTQEEVKVLHYLKETWNEFNKLPKVHNDDINDFRHHIHALQNIILAREGLRKMEEMLK
jgi:hypothetical protein